ncbi:CRISPR-associated protein, Cse1 family [Psychromonas ingrahamii 37]|uniref:CRISPR-associated protein, Cse1 family n=1 Tax=Psychromonas ingrahamii (strain DSM 17664 / CCUG 51855 / 37) TaxID=357804 RepID=A1SV74_PSYIN|nr:type I-E CRISPR-associated protein Cse1/CasA [Psychromonas ingrahamii]ABM03389.1 CRISPR-associated protein, Cse1 family [Psychromonas ingrahamii 37]
MNLLKDDFISTSQGKISLKTILTGEQNYQLQYYFDEIQLAMLQLLSSLSTVVLQPTVQELKDYLKNGLTPEQYEAALDKVESQWFESDCFMQSKPPTNAKWPDAPITKLLSGIECGTSANAMGLFSEIEQAEISCTDCMHALNYNLHMNIKGECFGPTGATGIRGGGAISTLIAGENLKQTLLNNTIAKDYFNDYAQLDSDAEQRPMWVAPLSGSVYQASKIGINRGLFALAYHIGFNIEDKPCLCDVCGSESEQSVKTFNREKYKGNYGSTKNGREAGAGWWPHPYTPRTIKEEGAFAVCARDQNWQSWQELGSYIVGKETDKATLEPAYIIKQFQYMKTPRQTNLLVGGNIADQGGITGRVYDLYSMPSSLNKHLSKVTQVLDSGLDQKNRLSQAFNKMFGAGYDKNFVGGIKENAMYRFTANAQQIIQRTLLDVERKEATELRKTAVIELKQEAQRIFMGVQRKYQHDLPLFKALVKGESALYRK